VCRPGRFAARVTEADSGKVKRLRHDPRVSVAPCTVRGRSRGPAVDGTADIVDDTEQVEALLARKYAWAWPAYNLLMSAVRRSRRQAPPEPEKTVRGNRRIAMFPQVKATFRRWFTVAHSGPLWPLRCPSVARALPRAMCGPATRARTSHTVATQHAIDSIHGLGPDAFRSRRVA